MYGFLLLLLAAVPIPPPGPPVTGPAEFARDTVAVFKVPTTGQLLVKPPAGLSVVKREGEWFVAGVPGAYKLDGYWIDFDNRRADVVEFAFRITGGPDPVPVPPGPAPGPTPPPGPVTPARLFVVVIEETADAVAARGVMFNDAALSARMKERGHKWRVADKDVTGPDGQPPADLKRFLAGAAGKPLPQVFLVDDAGKTRLQADLPGTPAALIDLLTKAGG